MPKPPDPSPEAASLYKKYLNHPAQTLPELTQRLQDYLTFVARVSQVNSAVDHALAISIAERLQQLLATAPAEKFKYVQAAALYFMEDEDAEGDLVSAGGFDDDITVLNAVCHHCGRDDLRLETKH
jgi:uncharacterized membrane protein YkvA (DUF1232 family)